MNLPSVISLLRLLQLKKAEFTLFNIYKNLLSLELREYFQIYLLWRNAKHNYTLCQHNSNYVVIVTNVFLYLSKMNQCSSPSAIADTWKQRCTNQDNNNN